VSVTHDDVRNIASLARVSVANERLETLAAELSGILGHMDALAGVDTTRVDTEASAGTMRLASDEGPSVQLARPPETIAPQWRDGFFLVPRLDTHGGDAGASGA
jgi:aspartyl-tRNA(Asn)/glutamyl-tRNA(Gln) amidotransferase subunit C